MTVGIVDCTFKLLDDVAEIDSVIIVALSSVAVSSGGLDSGALAFADESRKFVEEEAEVGDRQFGVGEVCAVLVKDGGHLKSSLRRHDRRCGLDVPWKDLQEGQWRWISCSYPDCRMFVQVDEDQEVVVATKSRYSSCKLDNPNLIRFR